MMQKHVTARRALETKQPKYTDREDAINEELVNE